MKKNKGFTLIELLAVIVILAIIALIAVPVVMSIIGKANKAAFKDSAYGIIKAGEYFYTDKLLEAQGMIKDKTFIFPNDIEGLEIKGSKPTHGYVTVNKKGQVEMAISNGKYCVTKGFEEDDVTISDGTCELSKEEETNEVYYNPNKAELCTKKEWENNADKNGKSGCMRWYIYGEEGNKQKLILDHNTTNNVAWISEEDYNELDPTGETGLNSHGSVTLMRQLEEDTTNWHANVKETVNIIDIQDILKLMPWYEKLEDKTNWQQKYREDTEKIISETLASIAPTTYPTLVDAYKAMTNEILNHPSGVGLPKYMHEDLYNDWADDNGDMVCPTYGYWTNAADDSHYGYAWGVSYLGVAGSDGVNDGKIGLRPVITLSK